MDCVYILWRNLSTRSYFNDITNLLEFMGNDEVLVQLTYENLVSIGEACFGDLEYCKTWKDEATKDREGQSRPENRMVALPCQLNQELSDSS